MQPVSPTLLLSAHQILPQQLLSGPFETGQLIPSQPVITVHEQPVKHAIKILQNKFFSCGPDQYPQNSQAAKSVACFRREGIQ